VQDQGILAMSKELHASAHVATFHVFPKSSFAIVLTNSVNKLAAPDATDHARSVVISEELTPERIAQLRGAVLELGRIVLLFSDWQTYTSAMNALRA
jgi:hypothetical protein